MEDADVVVLNTCCIRENADQRLYGDAGPPQGARGRQARDCRSPSAAAWPRRTVSIQEKVGWVDVVFGTHNLTSARAPAPGRGGGPRHGDPRRAGARVGRQPLLAPERCRELPYAAWVNIQTGCDNSCAFCIVPSVRGPEASRGFDDIVAR